MFWLLTTLALAECADDSVAEVMNRVVSLERAYLELREDAFDREHEALIAAVECLDQGLTLEQVVAVHEAKALAAFVDGELAASRKSWAAVKQLSPSYAPDESLLPLGHPFRAQFDEAVVDDERRVLERSPEGGWQVDSRPSDEVPQNRAFLLQGFNLDGNVVHSGYHYSVAEVPLIDFAELDETARQRRRRRMHWIGSIAGGGLAVGSLTAMGTAAVAQASVRDAQTPLSELESQAQSANTMSVVSLGLLGGAATVTSLTWAVRW